jgi:hypothetical protein
MLTAAKHSTAIVKMLAILVVLGAVILHGLEAAKAQSNRYDSSGLKIDLSDDIQAAIDSGVTLTFENQYAHAKHFTLFDWHTEFAAHEFVVTRHTLSNRYLVYESNKVEPRIFSSTRETMTYISGASLSFFSTHIAEHQAQQTHLPTTHKMRLRLSKTKLPGPMRLTAFIASDWDLDSGWKSWQSDQL